MNKNDFLDAVAHVDVDIIDNVLKKRAELAKSAKTRSTVLMRIVPIAAAVAILVSGVIAVFSMANRNKPEVPGADEPIVVPPEEEIFDIFESQNSKDNFDLSMGHLTIEGEIEASLFSYYSKNDFAILTIGYGMVDPLHQHLSKGLDPDYAFPVLRIEFVEEVTSSERPLINGNKDKYEKEFHGDDCKAIEMERYYKTELPCCEIVKMDFSNVSAGSGGRIKIRFGTLDTKTNTYHHQYRSFYYYVGENGIAFSIYGIDAAERFLYKIESNILGCKTGDGSVSLNNP